MQRALNADAVRIILVRYSVHTPEQPFAKTLWGDGLVNALLVMHMHLVKLSILMAAAYRLR